MDSAYLEGFGLATLVFAEVWAGVSSEKVRGYSLEVGADF